MQRSTTRNLTTVPQEASGSHTPRRAKRPGFFEGLSAKTVINVLGYCKAENTMGLVAGGPGIGKTTTGRHFKGMYTGVWYFTAHPSASTDHQMLRGLAAVLGVACRSSQPSFDIRENICRQLTREFELIIIDEAQHLKRDALETVRSIYDETEVGIVLMGDLDLHRSITGYPQLSSRISMHCKIDKPTDKDVECLAKAWSVNDPSVVSLLQQIARQPGGLRIANQVMHHATDLAEGPPSPDHVRVAANILGIEV